MDTKGRFARARGSERLAGERTSERTRERKREEGGREQEDPFAKGYNNN